MMLGTHTHGSEQGCVESATRTVFSPAFASVKSSARIDVEGGAAGLDEGFVSHFGGEPELWSESAAEARAPPQTSGRTKGPDSEPIGCAGRTRRLASGEWKACGCGNAGASTCGANNKHWGAAANEVAKHLAFYTCRLLDAQRGSA
jgi:hypothetical protein